MTKTKSTKRALLMSALALVMCVSMLVGTTFAWFTDSVTSSNNRIVAGNLDIELYYQNDEMDDWVQVDSNTNIFKKETLWEPGHTEVIKLKIANEGSLALKYQLGVNIVSELGSVNMAGDPFRLSDYIYFGIAEGEQDYAGRDEAIKAVDAGASLIKEGYSKSSSLEEGAEACLTMVVYMPTTVGNEANYAKDATVPMINLGLNLFATQFTSEEDSFGNDYDATAPWTGIAATDWYYADPAATTFTLTSAEDLAGLAKIVNDGVDTFEGQSIYLGANIDLNNVSWAPIGSSEGAAYKFDGSFYGNGYTIYNLRAVGTSGVGLFGYVFDAAHIEGVSIENAYVSGNDYVGAVLGTGYLAENCLKNCTVKNATIIATPFIKADGTYDGGAKAGAIAGYAINGHITGNKAIGCTIIAYRDLGGIVGMVSGENRKVTVSGNEVSDTTLSFVGAFGKYDDGSKENGNMAAVAGRVNNATVTDNTVAESVELDVSAQNAIMIFTVDELFAFAAKVNNGEETYKGKTVMIGADLDLQNREWTPIGNSTYSFKGVFDGNGKTIKNLKVTGNKSNVGLFGFTTEGEVRNLTVENARVSGRLNVGVVAGTPYTTKYNNITVKGHIEVNGMAYVGGVGGKNAYASWNNITVEADETSYVKAYSVENGTAYRTYVGGVIGFMGEGGHKVSNVTSNIDVIGSTCDVGGIVGIAHYGNTFENIICTGDVTITDAAEIGDAEEMGGIAGVWNNGGSNVTFTNCSFTGKLSANLDGAFLSNNTITGAAYSTSGNGLLVIDGATYRYVADAASLQAATTQEGVDVIVLMNDIEEAPVNTEAPYGNCYGIKLDGDVLDGNGCTLDFELGEMKNGKFDNYGIMTSGGTIKNITITGVFRGVMIMNPTENTYIDNAVIGDEDVCYSINTGEGDGTTDLIVTNSTIKAWNSYGTAIKTVRFENCTFAQGEYYTNVFGRLVKPYVDAVFTDCEFNSKFYIDLSQLGKDGDGNVLDPDTKIALRSCTVNGVKLTAQNWQQLIVSEDDCGNGQISIELKDGSYMTASNVVDYVTIE